MGGATFLLRRKRVAAVHLLHGRLVLDFCCRRGSCVGQRYGGAGYRSRGAALLPLPRQSFVWLLATGGFAVLVAAAAAVNTKKAWEEVKLLGSGDDLRVPFSSRSLSLTAQWPRWLERKSSAGVSWSCCWARLSYVAITASLLWCILSKSPFRPMKLMRAAMSSSSLVSSK